MKTFVVQVPDEKYAGLVGKSLQALKEAGVTVQVCEVALPLTESEAYCLSTALSFKMVAHAGAGAIDDLKRTPYLRDRIDYWMQRCI